MLLYTRYVTMFNYSLTHPIFLYVFSSLTRLKLSMYSLQARGGSLFLSGWRLWLPGKSNFHPYPGHTTGSKDHNTSLRSIRKISRRSLSRLLWLYQVNISVLSGINPMLDIEKYKFSEWGPKSKRSCIIPLYTPLQLWKHTFNRLLVALAIFDLMFVCSTVPIHVFPLFEYNNRIFALLYSRSKFFQFLKNITPLIHM